MYWSPLGCCYLCLSNMGKERLIGIKTEKNRLASIKLLEAFANLILFFKFKNTSPRKFVQCCGYACG